MHGTAAIHGPAADEEAKGQEENDGSDISFCSLVHAVSFFFKVIRKIDILQGL